MERALLSRREICLPRMDGWMPKEPFSSMTDRSAPLCARSSFPSFPGSFVRSFAVVPSSPIECDRRLKRPEEITTNRVSGPPPRSGLGLGTPCTLTVTVNSTCTEEERRPFLKNDPMPNPDRREGDPLIVNLTESPRLVARPPISLIAQVHLRHRKPNTGPTRHGHRGTLAV